MFSEESSICGLPQDFKIAYITSISDLNGADIVGMMKVDGSALSDLVILSTQVPKRMKLPKEFLVKPLLLQLLRNRNASCGNRLAAFKGQHGIGADGGPRFLNRTGSYSFALNTAKQITQVTHWTGAVAEVDIKCGLSSAWRLQDNFDDFTASMVMPNLPMVRLSSFFCKKTKRGPWSVPSYAGKPSELSAVAAELHTKLMVTSAAIAMALTVSEEVESAIAVHKKQEPHVLIKKARESAVVAMAKKNFVARTR